MHFELTAEKFKIFKNLKKGQKLNSSWLFNPIK